MAKILLLSKYSRKGASSRLRTHQYLPFLEESGIEVKVCPLFNDEYLNQLYKNGSVSQYLIFKAYFRRLLTLTTIFRYDFLWIEKELFPYIPAIFERIINLLNVSYVVDFDDAIFHNYDLSDNKIVRYVLGGKIDKVMELSSTTVAGNQYLADRAYTAGANNVMIIPTVVDITRYSVLRNENSKPVIGWIGSPSTQKYVVELLPVFKKLASTGFKLRLVGANRDIINQLPGIDVEVLTWRENTEVRDIQSMDIGIMPLNDGYWEKGKCGYKLIQYMACGKPVIASKVGANVDIINDGSVGMLASDHSDFYEFLNLLLNDVNLQLNMGMSGRKRVEKNYSIQTQFASLNRLFQSLIN